MARLVVVLVVALVLSWTVVPVCEVAAKAPAGNGQATAKSPAVRLVQFERGGGAQQALNDYIEPSTRPRQAIAPQAMNVPTIDEVVVPDADPPGPANEAPDTTFRRQTLTCDPNNPACQNGQECAGCRSSCNGPACSPRYQSMRRTRMVSYTMAGGCAAGACGAMAMRRRGPVRRLFANRPRLFGRRRGCC